jgi:hypothetical protein
MENPEFTERQINKALKAASPLDISVRWDGIYPDPEDDAVFDVYFDEDTTNYFVWDHGSELDVVECLRKHAYCVINTSRSHEGVAGVLIAVIEEDIAAGKLGEEA